jgi:Beta-propeller repeat
MNTTRTSLGLLLLTLSTGCGGYSGAESEAQGDWLGGTAQRAHSVASPNEQDSDEPTPPADVTAADAPMLEPARDVASVSPGAEPVDAPAPRTAEHTDGTPSPLIDAPVVATPVSDPPTAIVIADPPSVAPVAAASRLQTQWVRQWGGVHLENVDEIATDAQNNVIAVGHILVGTDDEGAEDRAQYLKKLSPTGAELWSIEQPDQREFDNSPNVTVDAQGDIFVANSVDGDGSADANVTRFDADGNELWSTTWGVHGVDFVYDVALDAAGNVYVAGQTDGGPGQHDQDAFMSKLDTEGNLLWSKRWGTEQSELASTVSVDGDGNLLVAVRTGYRVDAIDYAVTKFDAEQNLVWSYAWDSSVDTVIANLVTDSSGNVFVGGTDAGDGFVARLDEAGALTWRSAEDANLDEVNGIALGADGLLTAATVGYPTGTTSLSQFDVEGALLWTEQVGTPETENLYSVALDNAGHIVVAGSTYGAMEGVNAGNDDSFVLELSTVE